MKSAFTKKERCTAKMIFTGEKIIVESIATLINLTIKYKACIRKAPKVKLYE